MEIIPERKAFSSYIDGRSVRLVGAERFAFYGNDTLRPAVTLCGEQGSKRFPGPVLCAYLRTTRDNQQLFKQLWPVPVSREAHPAADYKRAEWRETPHLWGWLEHTGLVVCG